LGDTWISKKNGIEPFSVSATKKASAQYFSFTPNGSRSSIIHLLNPGKRNIIAV
jgi:hypothetical protein